MRFVGPLVLLGGLQFAIPWAAAAQQPGRDSVAAGGTVLGTILDASTSQALPGAVVLLEPGPAGAVVPVRGAPFWATGRTQVTDAQGAYRFTRLPPGEYRLLVRRLGYRPAVVAVDLRQNSPLRLSVGMTVQPIRLEPTEVKATRAPFRPGGAGTDAESAGRVDVDLYRQREFLESDARALTESDVTEAVTLGETDLFRALLRLPGVTTRDDFTAELWTRGAPWSQTRVYYDGMPLFNPLHTVGVFSGVNPDAVGAAFFHPGGRSAALGEGAAAVLDLASRPARGGAVGGSAELSAVSGRLALDGPLGGRGGWMVAGRRSYVDLLTDVFVDSAGRIPYAFQDLASRVDIPLGGVSSLVVSGLWERDDLRGTVRDLLRDNRGHWGNAVLRASLTTPLAGLVMRHTLGQSRFAANVTRLVLTDTTGAPVDTGVNVVVPVHQPTDNGITETILSGSLESGGTGGWSAGYQVTAMRQHYVGPIPRPYPLVVVPDTLQLSVQRSVVAFWGAHRWEAGRFALDAGVRLELPGSMANVPALAMAPRVSARYATGPTFALSAAVARTYQYTQTIAPAGPGVGPDLHVSDVWGMADDTVPALRSDLATLGAEAWLGPGWLGTLTVYGRRVTGVAVPDPEPGTDFRSRPLFVTATNRAAGVELSARRLMGRVTGSIAYSEGWSRIEAAGWAYPAGAERRRMLDLTGMVRIAQGWRAGAAFTAASGAPFTRFLLHTVVPLCDSLSFCGDTLYAAGAVEQPNVGRAPAYVTLDLLGEWRQAFGSWAMTVFVQVRNALNLRNAVTYVGSHDMCTQPTGDQRQARPGVCDDFDHGLPLLPLVGVSVAF
jgi:Carboxypeptidase regulatory-like domain/TonB dependent receptor-like, beta-barrel